jgi:hypothetical protein
MPAPSWLTPQNVTTALQQNPQLRTDIATMLQQNGDTRSPEQWLHADLEAGDTNSQFISAVQGAANGQVNLPTLPASGAGTGAGGTTTPTTGAGFGNLVAPATPPVDFEQAPAPAVTGGNYNQVQNATQGGQFATVGANYNQQQGTTGQQQTGTQSTQGTQSTNQQQNQNTTSTGQQVQDSRTTGSTTQTTQGNETQQAIDTLGFGKLLQDQAGAVGASDAARTAWLQDTMQTGGTAFNSQIDQAIRNSLTGPQMTGAGDSARARAAGYGAAEIGRTNLNQRLAASEQLAGPTGLANLSTAANPYIGRQTSSTGTGTTFQDLLTKGTTSTTGTQNTTGTSNTQSLTDQLQNSSQNTTGFQNLISQGSEAQAGTTAGQSSQAGAGQIPQGQPVKTGGCVLCTAAYEMKLPKSNMLRVLRRVIKHKLVVDRSAYASAARGYFAIFTPVARTLLSHPRLARTFYPLARATVYEELRLSGRRLPWKAVPWGVHWVGHNACGAVGFFLPLRGVRDPVITDIARRNNILFEVTS